MKDHGEDLQAQRERAEERQHLPATERQVAAITDFIRQDNARTLRRDRPYSGQPQTFQGERGRFLVNELQGVTVRDIADAIARGFIAASGVPQALELDHEHYTFADVYSAAAPFQHIDPLAVVQNACIVLEKMLGVYPNLGGRVKL